MYKKMVYIYIHFALTAELKIRWLYPHVNVTPQKWVS